MFKAEIGEIGIVRVQTEQLEQHEDDYVKGTLADECEDGGMYWSTYAIRHGCTNGSNCIQWKHGRVTVMMFVTAMKNCN